jgi:AcrR family transcriptional regulator
VQNEPVKTGRSKRWAGHRAQRRTELVEAAVAAIREHGPGVSVAAIAAAAGVTKPVLYRHFTDRADLQRAVSERAAQLLLHRLLPELAREREPVEHIRSIVDAFLAGAQDEPQLWHFVVHNPGGSSETGEVVEHSMALVAGLLSTALGDRLRERGVDAGGAEAFAYGLVGMVYTAGDWWLGRQTMSRAALTDYLTAMIWGGLTGVFGAEGRADDLRTPLRLVSGLPDVFPDTVDEG